MTIGVNATLRVVAQFQIASTSRAQNVYHAQHVSIESKTDEQVVTACSDWVVEMMDTLTARQASAYVLEKVECFVLNFPLWEPIGVATPTWDGSNVNQRMPSGVALMVAAYKERTGYADRKYLAGFTAEDASADGWQSALLTAAANYAAAWITQFAGPESTLLLPVSYRAVDGLTRPYTSTSVASVISYQRRRKPGVGLT